MIARFVSQADKRLNVVSDFEIQKVDSESGETVDDDWYENTTMKSLLSDLKELHNNHVEISVLDFEGELRGIVTPSEKSVNHHFVVLNL